MYHLMPGTVEFMYELRNELEALRKLPNRPERAISVIEAHIKQFDDITRINNSTVYMSPFNKP